MVGGNRASVFPVGCKIGDLKAKSHSVAEIITGGIFMAETKSCCNDKVSGKIREAVCIDTNRVYDSCADKDCLADLRVYFPPQYQQTIDRATNVDAGAVRYLTSLSMWRECRLTAAFTRLTSHFSSR